MIPSDYYVFLTDLEQSSNIIAIKKDQQAGVIVAVGSKCEEQPVFYSCDGEIKERPVQVGDVVFYLAGRVFDSFQDGEVFKKAVSIDNVLFIKENKIAETEKC
jgi:co-chaperonin GroES (HSP10)